MQLLQKDHLRLLSFLLFSALWITAVFTVSNLVSRSIESGCSSLVIPDTLPQRSDVEESGHGNRVSSAALVRRIPLVRYNSRGERRYGSGTPAAPRFYSSFALPVELLPVELITSGIPADGTGKSSFLLEVCLKSSTPVRAGPVFRTGVSVAGAAVC